MAQRARMHQTTIRFAPDVWSELEQAARAGGVSAAQYVREATVARLAYSAGARQRGALGAPAPGPSSSEQAQALSLETLEDSHAVWAQAQLARSRSRLLREAAKVSQARVAGTQAGLQR